MPAIAHENKILGNTNNLNELSDVNLTSPTSGQVLTIRNGEWVNEDPQAGDSIIYLTKAEYDALTPVANQMYGITDWSPEALALIKDGEIVANATWSSEKINTQLGLKANSADVPTKAQITNPNLLDNPWFTVNQRGESSYPSTTWTYWVDRWTLLSKSSGTIGRTILLDSGIKISADTISTTCDIVAQRKMKDDFVFGKAYTLSFMLGDGTIYSKSGVITEPDGTYKINIYLTGGGLNVRIANEINQQVSCIITAMEDNPAVTLRAVKLELGSISTLALDTAPNTATELLKCQRYYHIYATESLRPANMYDCVPQMRTTPAQSTITIGGTTYYANTADL